MDVQEETMGERPGADRGPGVDRGLGTGQVQVQVQGQGVGGRGVGGGPDARRRELNDGCSAASAAGVPGGLQVRDVVVRYGGTTAVAGVSLDIAPGEVVALLGPSGCGKSSLLRAIAGLEPVAEGTVSWEAQDLTGTPVHRRGFGLMFQEGQLFAHRDVAGNVAYGIPRMSRAARTGRVRELLDVVGLAGYERRPVATLSGGEKQRVALARSLAPWPRLLLLDEPLSALDRGLRERLAMDLRAALVDTGTTAVFVTHDHDEAFTVADRIAVMDAGRIQQVAPPEELWREPATHRVAEFLGYQAFVPLPELDRLLAIGPRGLVVVGSAETSGSRDADGAAGRVDGDGSLDGVDGDGSQDRVDRTEVSPREFTGVVVGSAFRRGVTEVTVDVVVPVPSALPASEVPPASVVQPGPSALPVAVDGGPVLRLVAVPSDSEGRAGPSAGVRWVPGDVLRLRLDESGCAVVRAARPGERG